MWSEKASRPTHSLRSQQAESSGAPWQPSQRVLNLPAKLPLWGGVLTNYHLGKSCPWLRWVKHAEAVGNERSSSLASQRASRCRPHSRGGCGQDGPARHPRGYTGPPVSAGDSHQGLPSRESFDFKASAHLMITRDAPKCAGNTHIRKRCLSTTSMVTSHCLLVLPEAGPGQGWAWEYGQCAQAGAVPWQQHSPHAVDGSSRGGGGGGPLPTSPWLLPLRSQYAFEGGAHGSGEGLRPSLGLRQRFPPTPAARNTGPRMTPFCLIFFDDKNNACSLQKICKRSKYKENQVQIDSVSKNF